ncbi:uncharacterized protein LOC119579548 [Penaeus monodon]|uniref:uncharacterized protein LOC119579548 n=1 Tax=Penaeus monodon TaxID=6687 RepID=UPI0018A7DA8E|nr:uncharacterized protein LOC119579548 [Penaeus monodon]XP_037783392.1 uncharacterized protein LOC119579548 [Penaeus monodon]XP_037783401.1 uncharacterized protein LOC119579548 [Penaeus monodon]
MRVPTCIIGVKMVALMDLANIFFLDTWGTEEAKRKWLETKGDLPIFFGVEAHVPPDLANIQVSSRKELLVGFSLATLTLLTLYLSFILPYSAHTSHMSSRSLHVHDPHTGIKDFTRESVRLDDSENFQFPETPRLVKERSTSGRKRRRSRSRRGLSRYFKALWWRFKHERPSLSFVLGRLGVTKTECQIALVCHAHSYLMNLPAGVRGLLVMITSRFSDLSEYEEGIVTGLGGGTCDSFYQSENRICPDPYDVISDFLGRHVLHEF